MSGYLSHDKALEMMKRGAKVAHSSFTSDEYLYISDEIIRDENGYHFEKGFQDRKDWDPEWFVVGWLEAPEDSRKYSYTEKNSPLIMSTHGIAEIVEIDFSKTIRDMVSGEIACQVTYTVSNTWDPSEFYVGYWGKDFLDKSYSPPNTCNCPCHKSGGKVMHIVACC